MRAGGGAEGGKRSSGGCRQVDIRVRRSLIARLATLQLTTDNARGGGRVRGKGRGELRVGKGKTLSLLWHSLTLLCFLLFFGYIFLVVPVVLKPISNHI